MADDDLVRCSGDRDRPREASLARGNDPRSPSPPLSSLGWGDRRRSLARLGTIIEAIEFSKPVAATSPSGSADMACRTSSFWIRPTPLVKAGMMTFEGDKAGERLGG